MSNTWRRLVCRRRNRSLVEWKTLVDGKAEVERDDSGEGGSILTRKEDQVYIIVNTLKENFIFYLKILFLILFLQ